MKIGDVKLKDLPRTWRKHPAPRRFQEIGNDWLDRGVTAVLRVPSALLPTESNYLVNPGHRDLSELRVLRRLKFDFDERIASRRKETRS